MSAPEPKQPKAPLSAYLIAILFVNLPWIVSLVLAVAELSRPGLVGVFMGLGLGVATVIVGRRRRLGGEAVAIAGTTLLAALVLPPLTSTKLVDAVLIASDRVPTVSLDELRETRAAVVSLDEGVVRSERMGSKLASREPGTPGRAEQGWDSYAAPLVPASWDGDSPVSTWLLCRTSDERTPAQTRQLCLKKMQQAPIVGRTYRAERGSPMVEPDAIAAARREHEIATSDELLVIETSDDLEGWARMFIAIGGLLSAALSALALGGVWWLAGATRPGEQRAP